MRHIYIFLLILFFFSLFILPVYADLPTVQNNQTKLEYEIQKMLDAGHLRPGYYLGDEPYGGFSSNMLHQAEEIEDMWHNPADTFYTLAQAYPHLPRSMQTAVVTYLDREYIEYKPYIWTHTGTVGARREHNDVPVELQQYDFVHYSSVSWQKTPGNPSIWGGGNWKGWRFNPFNFYAMYQYAKLVQIEKSQNIASNILADFRRRIDHQTDEAFRKPTAFLNIDRDSKYFMDRPHALNTYIAGYIGWLGLQQMAGETLDSQTQAWLEEAKVMRLEHLRTLDPDSLTQYEAGGFLWLVPELGEYLYSQDRQRVKYYVDTYQKMVPFWYTARATEQDRLYDHWQTGFYPNEGSYSAYYQYSSLFQAKALALKEPKEELEKYLDVPSVWRGDLFYIQNLVATLDATGATPPPACTVKGDANCSGKVDILDLSTLLRNFGKTTATRSEGDVNGDGFINIADLSEVIREFGKP